MKSMSEDPEARVVVKSNGKNGATTPQFTTEDVVTTRIYFTDGKPPQWVINMLKDPAIGFRFQIGDRESGPYWVGAKANLIGTPFEMKEVKES